MTKLEAENISELHGKYTMLFAFANQELARANVALIRLNSRISLRSNAVFRERPTLNAQERWRRDAILESDHTIEALEAQITVVKMEREWAQMFATNYEKYIAALSRELSRKCSLPAKL